MSLPLEPVLTVTFEGTPHTVTTDQEFTFGRAASLIIDSANRELHRVQGVLRFDNGSWHVHNNARATSLVVTHHESPSFSKVAPGATLVLPFASCSITFSAGRANYRLDVVDESAVDAPNPVPTVSAGDRTVTAGHLIFNEEQFQLLAVLGEPRMAGPVSVADLPSNRQIAKRLGWNVSKVNRKLDNLCLKLDKVGVQGLRGDMAGAARMRRVNLANYVVESGLLTEETLALLPED